ncbi:MAG: DUF1178 family protein [Deltaproteobacteria bacterium]|jgi:hypothetical protein|nr:DUF1178 family protein [Deltaproteobacteria bacterium]
MVIFDLICHNNHGFEGWFKDLPDLEEQLGAGLLSCPVCGDTDISRRPSTFGIGKSKAVSDRPVPQEGGQPIDMGALAEAKRAELYGRLETLSDMLREDFTDVGAEFTTEALKMHYGASPKRNIRGMSTEREESILKNEGIEFFKVPMLVRKSPAAS